MGLTAEIWTFLVVDTFKCAIFFVQICCYFTKNWQNSGLFAKIWTFLTSDIFKIKIFMLKYVIFLKIGKICFFFPLMSKYRLFLQIFLNWAIFFFFSPWIGYYSDENRQNLHLTVKMWTCLVQETFINARFFAKILLFWQNSRLIIKIWIFLGADTFINARLFSTNTQLFRRKSKKFATNCKYMNFSRGWYF